MPSILQHAVVIAACCAAYAGNAAAERTHIDCLSFAVPHGQHELASSAQDHLQYSSDNAPAFGGVHYPDGLEARDAPAEHTMQDIADRLGGVGQTHERKVGRVRAIEAIAETTDTAGGVTVHLSHRVVGLLFRDVEYYLILDWADRSPAAIDRRDATLLASIRLDACK